MAAKGKPARLAALRKRARAELARRKKARTSLLDFIQYCWWRPWPLVIGRHTRAMCSAIDEAIDAFRKGESTFLLMAIPFAHGKSDVVSRALHPFFLARCADLQPDTIMSGYGAGLVQDLSVDAMNIIRSPAFQRLFPDVRLAPRQQAIDNWAIEGSTGHVTATGLGGAFMGKRGALVTLDDYCKGRVEARSEAYRKSSWAGFQDLFSRRPPVGIFLIAATPWHIDDVRGRLKAKMAEDPSFPQFQEITFPAKNADPVTGAWDGTYLFEERFPPEWYGQQYATQGSFAPALLDCEPVVEGGNRFAVDKIDYRDTLEGWPGAMKGDDGQWIVQGYKRGWDLASSTKERQADDPDWTFGVHGYVTTKWLKVAGVAMPAHEIWIADAVYCRAEAPERNKLILDTVTHDGSGVSHYIESFGAYKDTYTEFRNMLKGIVMVYGSQMPGDKSAKLAPLEPAFDAGRVHVLKAPWNTIWVKHFTEFPEGAHEDACDATSVMFDAFTRERAGIAAPWWDK